MKTEGGPSVIFACGVWLVGLSLSLVANAADEAPLMGSRMAHELLWSQYERTTSEWDSRASQRYDLNAKVDQALVREQAISTQIKGLSARLGELKREKELTPNLIKDEFESTQAFEARRRTATAAYRGGVELKIRTQESALEAAQSSLASERRTIAERKEQLRAQSEQPVPSQPTVPATSDRFMLRVKMDSYDADRERIPGFQLPGRFNVGSSPGGPRLFELNGMLSGISVGVDKAKEIRGLSDSGRLFAVFRAKPAGLIFESSMTRITPGKAPTKASEGEKFVLAGVAALVINALGGDAQTAGNLSGPFNSSTENSIFSSAKPDKEEFIPIRLIRGGWLGSAQIEALYGWDESVKEWKMVLKNSTPSPSPAKATSSSSSSQGWTVCVIDSRPITGIETVRFDRTSNKVILTWQGGEGAYQSEKFSDFFLSSWGLDTAAIKASRER